MTLAIKPLNFYPCVVMDEIQSRALVTFIMEPEKLPAFYDQAKEEFIVKMCEKRCEVLEINIDQAVLLYITLVLAPNPAVVVMYLHAIAQKTRNEVFTINDFCELFPNGFPTEETLNEAWDAQKVRDAKIGMGNDNLLDNPDVFKALYEGSPAPHMFHSAFI